MVDIQNVEPYFKHTSEQLKQINRLKIQEKWCISVMIIIFIVLLIFYFIKVVKAKKDKRIKNILFILVRIIAVIISITYIKEGFFAAIPSPNGIYTDVYYGPGPFFITGFFLYVYSFISIILDYLKNIMIDKIQTNKTLKIISYIVNSLLYIWLLIIFYFIIIDKEYYSFRYQDSFDYLALISYIATLAIIIYLIIKIIIKFRKGELTNGRDD